MAYTHITRGEFRAALAARLNDAASTFWVETELNVYIDEALQLLGVAALYFRERVELPTVASQIYYDVKDALAGDGSMPLTRATTARSTVNAIEYHLQEPATDWDISSVWGGTAMFTMADLQGALQRRVNQYLMELRRVIHRTSESVAPIGDGRLSIDQSTFDILRAVWWKLDGTGSRTKPQRLLLMDEQTAGRQSPRWTVAPATPLAYSIVVTPTLQVQLIPPPIDTGGIDLYSTMKNADLDVTTTVVIDLPDDLVQFCKWGALADLLGRDGEARDPERSVYCEQRFNDGVQLGRIYTSLLNAQIDGAPVQIVSPDDLDSQLPRWESVSGKPSLAVLFGLNLLGFYPVPNAAYSFTGDVVRNAVLPDSDADHLQVDASWIDALLDYCEHLALFKCGGVEWQATVPHYERMMRLAADYNSKLKAASGEFEILATESSQQEKDRPRRAA